ncbi:fimbrial protein [Providencia sp. Me31A]|uniref:fimbrial protein n=1 Tax=Providencia sp. Me31A TaxID=3392637 RepID=UPI003D2DD30C
MAFFTVAKETRRGKEMSTLITKLLWWSGLIFAWLTMPAAASNAVDININGRLIVNPPCELTSTTGSNSIGIEFDDIVIRNMSTNTSGRAYRKSVPYKLVCDAPDSTGVAVYLSSPQGASFDNRLVSTTNPNVGIMFLNNNGLVTRIGNYAGMNAGEQTEMEVVPIRNNAEGVIVEAGDFSATATLTVVYR